MSDSKIAINYLLEIQIPINGLRKLPCQQRTWVRVWFENRIWAMGGNDNNSKINLNLVESYDPFLILGN